MSHIRDPYTVSVSTTATLLQHPSSPAGVRIVSREFTNIGANTIYIGGPNVAASGANQGRPLAAGESFPDNISNGNYYGIVAAATENMLVFEVIN